MAGVRWAWRGVWGLTLLGLAGCGAEPGREQVEELLSQGRESAQQCLFGEAEQIFQQALTRLDELPGQADGARAEVLGAMGWSRVHQGRYAEADEALETAIQLGSEALGPDDLVVAEALRWSGVLRYHQHRFAESAERLDRAAALLRRTLGEQTDEYAHAVQWQGSSLVKMGFLDEAGHYFEHALEARRQAPGPRGLGLAQAFNAMGIRFDDLDEYDRAESIYLQGLDQLDTVDPAGLTCLDETVYGELLNNVAVIYDETGRHGLSRDYHKMVIANDLVRLGPDHFYLGISLHNLACTYLNEGEYDQALPILRESLRVYEESQGPDHISVILPLERLATAEENLGDPEEAVELRSRIERIQRQSLEHWLDSD